MSDTTASDSELVVNVKTINSEVYQFTVNPQTSVEDFKTLIRRRTDITEDRQRLIYRGKVLTDGTTLGEYRIESGHTVQFVARPENYRELQQSASNQQPATAPTVTTIQQTALDQMMRDIFGGEGTGAATEASRQQGNLFGPSATPMTMAIVDDGSMEHIRQDFLTLRTILATIDDPTVGSESANGLHRGPHPRFYPGQWLDVKDTVNQWLEATVMNVDYQSNAIFVHYNGWPSRWDEWISFNSPRIAPFRSRTAHSTALTSFVSPTPNVRIAGAPSTGADDIRTLLPEIRNMLRRLQPMIEEAADIAEQSYLTEHPSATPGLLVGSSAAQSWQAVTAVGSGSQHISSSAAASAGNGAVRSTAIWSEAELHRAPIGASSSSSSSSSVSAGVAGGGSPIRASQRVALSFSPTRIVESPAAGNAVLDSEHDSESAAALFNIGTSVVPEELVNLLAPLLPGLPLSAESEAGSSPPAGSQAVPRVVSQTTFVVGTNGAVRQIQQPTISTVAEVPRVVSEGDRDEVSDRGVDSVPSSGVEFDVTPADREADSEPVNLPSGHSSAVDSRESSSASEARLRTLCGELCPLLDRFGRALSDTSPFLRSYSLPPNDSGASSAAPSREQQQQATPPPPLSLEETLLQLMGVSRPPSPEPIRAYRSPIRTLPHSPPGMGSGGGNGMRSGSVTAGGTSVGSGPRLISVSPAVLGAGATPRVEMHIAVVNRNGQLVSNTPVTPAQMTAPTSAGVASSAVTGATQSSSQSAVSQTVDTPAAVSAPAAPSSVDLSSVQSLHTRATSLLQQVQEISARSQQLNERTTAVTEYSNALHSIIRNINTVEEIRTSQRRINEINAQIETIRNRALAISATAAGIRERTAQVTAAASTGPDEDTANRDNNENEDGPGDAASAARNNQNEPVSGLNEEDDEESDSSSVSDPPLALPGEGDDDDDNDNDEWEEEYGVEEDYEEEGMEESREGLLYNPQQKHYHEKRRENDDDEEDEEEEVSSLLSDLVPTVRIDTLMTSTGASGSEGQASAAGTSTAATSLMDYERTERMNPSITEQLQYYSGANSHSHHNVDESDEQLQQPESVSHSVDSGDEVCSSDYGSVDSDF